MLKKVLKNKKGFTLVELLAVLVIIGIIAAIAVPAIGNIIDNSKEDAIKADAITVLEAARLANTTGDLDTNETYNNSDSSEKDVMDDFLENYVDQIDDRITLESLAISPDGVPSFTGTISNAEGDLTLAFNNVTIDDLNKKDSDKITKQ